MPIFICELFSILVLDGAAPSKQDGGYDPTKRRQTMKAILTILAVLFCFAIVTCTDEAGTNTASGTYIWNSETGVLIWNWTSSDFTCNGPELGADTTTGVTITSTTMTWSDMDGMTWVRQGGTADDIVGTWTAEDPNGNSYTVTFAVDGTVSVTATILNCDDNNTKVASGTYTWNSETYIITMNTTSSNFTCQGPAMGADSMTGVTVTSTTLTWADAEMTWYRSGGSAGDIVGTWTAVSPANKNYTLVFNANGTFTVTAVIDDCDGGAYASSQHWSGNYLVQLSYDDPNRDATSVSVTGPGITGSKALTYSDGRWNSWTPPSSFVSFGTTYPAGLPFTYTFSISDNSGTRTASSTVACFQESFASELAPVGTASGTPTFSWTGINDINARYEVQLSDDNGRIWNSANVIGTSIMYSGPALSPGVTYHYDVVVNRSSTCDEESFAQGSFVYQ